MFTLVSVSVFFPIGHVARLCQAVSTTIMLGDDGTSAALRSFAMNTASGETNATIFRHSLFSKQRLQRIQKFSQLAPARLNRPAIRSRRDDLQPNSIRVREEDGVVLRIVFWIIF